MKTDTLVRMANQIGAFFDAMPDRDEALEGIAGHIKRFWDPRMRRELFTHIDEQAGAGLSQTVLAALQGRRALLL